MVFATVLERALAKALGLVSVKGQNSVLVKESGKALVKVSATAPGSVLVRVPVKELEMEKHWVSVKVFAITPERAPVRALGWELVKVLGMATAKEQDLQLARVTAKALEKVLLRVRE